IEAHTGQGSHHLEALKTGAIGRALALLQDAPPQSAPGMERVDKERPDLCGIHRRIEPRVIALRTAVAAEQGPAPAPSATTYDLPFGVRDDEVRAIADQSCIEAKSTLQGRLDLLAAIVVSAKL